MTQRPIRTISALAVVAILAAACSSGGSASPSSAAASVAPSTAVSPSTAASPSSPASPSATASAAIELKVATGSGSIGSYLTGADGKTLYIFKNDTANSGKSTCNGQCADNWPPLVVAALTDVKADSGATGTLTLVTRDDGKMQVAYKGLPLYYFKNDAKAGDVNGQGLNNVWFVAAP
jgi:predicted lipoprotein with Yx(FWY)xxD motif